MAEVVDDMPARKVGRSYLYPWDDWLNGQTWKLTQGVDFHVYAYSFVTYALKMIRARDLPLRVIRRRDVVWIGPRDGDAPR